MRVVKEAKERRNEILDCAVLLFASKGYEKTSVTDIMNQVGIAKGTLYYHFKSKEEILDGIITRIFDTTIDRANAIVNDPKMDVHEKMLQALLSLQVKEEGALQILEEAHKPQNALMHQKMLHRMIREVTPILAKIIEEGNALGVFHTKYPYESAELFITYGNIVFDNGFMEFSKEELSQKILAFIASMERVLGSKEGSMSYVLQMFFWKEDE